MAQLLTGVKMFVDDMKTLNDGIHLWASLYPFPQILLGGYLTVTRGITVRPTPPESLLTGGRIEMRPVTVLALSHASNSIAR